MLTLGLTNRSYLTLRKSRRIQVISAIDAYSFINSYEHGLQQNDFGLSTDTHLPHAHRLQFLHL